VSWSADQAPGRTDREVIVVTKKHTAKGDPKKHRERETHHPDAAPSGSPEEPRPKMSEKDYQAELKRLHGELVALQEWVKATGAKVMIVFEGRDTAGKGGVIKAIMERVSPRTFRVVALPAPSDREKSQMYLQRYLPHFPAAGEVVIWDRSWYNRAGVERVMGFTPEESVERFLELTPLVEKWITASGIVLLKYWLEVSPEEQTRRLTGRMEDPRKVWKLTDMDLKSYLKWDEYTQARDAMFRATSTSWAPWFVAVTDDKKRGRLNVIRHLLDHVPYQPLAARDVALPEREATATAPPEGTYQQVPDRY
jgi:polyphosphate kinase 2